MPLEERFTHHRDARIRYLVGGNGPPLVLCHGFLGSAENFETWFDELSSLRTLVVPDLPGCGLSAPLPSGSHTGDGMAARVLALCDELGLHRFDLGGLCLGSSVAMSILKRRPAAVDRLILHTPLLAPRLVRRRFHLQVRGFMAPGVHSCVTWLSRRRVVSDLYKRLLVEGANVDHAAAEANFRNQLRADPRASREWLLDGLRRQDTSALRSAGRPTVIIVAGDDRIVDVALLRRVVRDLPQVSLVEVDDAGHGWTEAYVRRQLEVLNAFLGDRPLPQRPRVVEAA